MSAHPTYLPKKDTQPWRILKLLSARMPLTSVEIATELSIKREVTVQALYLLAHRYGLIYQGKSMSGYLLTKKGHTIARRLGFSGKALVKDSSASSALSASSKRAVKTVARRRGKRGGVARAADVGKGDLDRIREQQVQSDDLARILREQDGKRKGMRAKRTGVQIIAEVGAGGAGAGGAGAGTGANAFAEKHPDLVKERAACLARVAAIDAYAEACEKLYASSLGG